MASIWDTVLKAGGAVARNPLAKLGGEAAAIPALGASAAYALTDQFAIKPANAAVAHANSATNYNTNPFGSRNDRLSKLGLPLLGQKSGQVQGASTQAGGGGGGAGDANLSPVQIAALKHEIGGSILQHLNDAYNSIYGQYDAQAQEKAGQLRTDQAKQEDAAQKQYLSNAEQLANLYHARGTYNSNERTGAEDQNTDTYQKGLEELRQAELGQEADLGRTVASTKAELDAGRPKFDLSQYNDVNSLSQLRDQLNQHIADLQTKGAGIGPSKKFNDYLQTVAPKQSNVTAQLKSYVDNLVNSSAPPNAKAEVLKGYLKSNNISPDDQNYWLNYLLNNGATAQKVA